jgi:hypothetical protein
MKENDRQYEELGVKGHKFPQSLLEQINENSKGGFFLAWVDEDDSPTFFSNFDNDIVERALLDFTLETVRTLKAVQSEMEASCFDFFPEEDMGEDYDDYDDYDDEEESC